jgi:hypothetical protein
MNRDVHERAAEDAFHRGFYGIPDDETLRGMSVAELAALLSSCEKGSAKFVVVEEELLPRRNAEPEKRWFERPIGQIGIGIVITVLAACAVYLIKTYVGIEL